MVMIQRDSVRRRPAFQRIYGPLLLCSCIAVLFWLIITFPDGKAGTNGDVPTSQLRTAQDDLSDQFSGSLTNSVLAKCPYKSLDDLTDAERHPRAGPRHMVDPPADTKLTLVCCDTTKGPWSILVHHSWAPNGAGRFKDMVKSGYFNKQRVPLMRCVHGFLCQFGLAGSASRQFSKTLEDDPNWLPEGPEHRKNKDGVHRFATGYMAYAGGGPNSRNNQYIVALRDNGPLAGGSPWEVPWGELVGEHSFETLSKIYTGYGEDGPKQSKLWRDDYLEKVPEDFPDLDFINSCHIVDKQKE